MLSRFALLGMIPLVFFFTSEGTWNLRKQRDDGGWSGGFFMAQAEAIARRRLDVERKDIQGKCFDRRLRCYGYMGVTPSLLRLPVLPVLRRLESAMTPLYLGVAVLLGYWAALQLLMESLVGAPDRDRPRALVLGYAATGALALGPGGTLLFLTRPAVFEEATAWAVAFYLLAVGRVWAWCRSQRFRALVLAVLFAVASANARPTAATACGVLGLIVAAVWRHRDSRAGRRVLVAAACLSLLPGLTAGGVLWLKFRTPIPDLRLNEQVAGAPHWTNVLRANGNRTAGLVFTPTELVAYFRPDAVTIQHRWPFFDFRFPREPILWVPPLAPGGAYLEEVASLTSTMPLPWILNVTVVVWLAVAGWRLATARRGRPGRARAPVLSGEQWVCAGGSVASASAMAILIVTTFRHHEPLSGRLLRDQRGRRRARAQCHQPLPGSSSPFHRDRRPARPAARRLVRAGHAFADCTTCVLVRRMIRAAGGDSAPRARSEALVATSHRRDLVLLRRFVPASPELPHSIGGCAHDADTLFRGGRWMYALHEAGRQGFLQAARRRARARKRATSNASQVGRSGAGFEIVDGTQPVQSCPAITCI